MNEYDKGMEDLAVHLMHDLVDKADGTVWYNNYTTMFDHIAKHVSYSRFADEFPDYA